MSLPLTQCLSLFVGYNLLKFVFTHTQGCKIKDFNIENKNLVRICMYYLCLIFCTYYYYISS